jgi:hypothetical protein
MPLAHLLKRERCIAFGYRAEETNAIPKWDGTSFNNSGKIIRMDPTFKLLRFTDTSNMPRRVVMASLGPHVQGYAMPHPDMTDSKTALAGAMYRFCRHIPRRINRRKFRSFVDNWLSHNMTPLEPYVDTSFDTWIAKTPYTQARKAELSRKYHEMNAEWERLDKKYVGVKSFVKDEVYPAFKHARGINSRADEFKCVVGPIFQLISDQLFSLPWFIKKIPIDQRPDYILDMLHEVGTWYMTTDYTSFEAHFDKTMMENCEFRLYKYMTQHLPEGDVFMKTLFYVLANSPNHIQFKHFSLEIQAKRMSGEMNTSLGNGFSNLMFMLYLTSCNGNDNVRGVIEGDDGLFVMSGPIPSPERFAGFGLDIKIINFSDINHASFCGMVFDLDERKNVTNPIDEIVNFSWCKAMYARSKLSKHKMLLRCKALSLIYQYPNCPILTAFAHKILKLTAGISVRDFILNGNYFNQYEKVIMIDALKHWQQARFYRNVVARGLLGEPGLKTRQLVEQLYGISVQDQCLIENYINEMSDLSPLNCDVLSKYCPTSYSEYFDSYVVSLDPANIETSYQFIWPQLWEMPVP